MKCKRELGRGGDEKIWKERRGDKREEKGKRKG